MTQAPRRRQRSARLGVAVGLLVAAAALVVVAFAGQLWIVAAICAAGGVGLGAAAARITHAELVDSRRDAARDRARQAQAYRLLTDERVAEQGAFVAHISARLERREATIAHQQRLLAEAAEDLVAARADLAVERADAARLTTRLGDAEERAAQAIVRVVELEQELDVMLAEWRTGTATGTVAPQRRHA